MQGIILTRAVTRRAARKPPRDGAGDDEAEGDEGIDEVSFRPRA